MVCTVSNSVQEVDVGAEALEIRGVTAELAARLCKHVGDTSDTTLGETVREVGLGRSQDSSRGTEENGRGLHLDGLICCRLDLFVE